MNAEFVSQLLRPQRLVLHREALPVSVPLMISRNVDNRATTRTLGKPTNPGAQWIVDIAGSDEHIEVRVQTRSEPEGNGGSEAYG